MSGFAGPAADTLRPPDVYRPDSPWIVNIDTLKPPMVVPLPTKPVMFTPPDPIPYRVDPLPESFELKPPSTRPGGFYPLIRHFTTADGLPSSGPVSIFCDSKGMLWIHFAGEGIYRYDGQRFSRFALPEGFNYYKFIREDSRGNMWIQQSGTQGLFRSDGKSVRIVTVPTTWTQPGDIAEDKHGRIWIRPGSTVDSVAVFDGKTLEKLGSDKGVRGSLYPSIFADAQQNIWIGSDSGLFKYDGEKIQAFGLHDGWKGATIMDIAEDRKGNIWLDTRKAGQKIEIPVKDNGTGIPEKVREKIFQPFFTTKPTGKGTGLGLSLSYDIVKAHGGEIRAETKEGEESAFTIQLPV